MYASGEVVHAFGNFGTTLESEGGSLHDLKRDDFYSIGGIVQLLGISWWVLSCACARVLVRMHVCVCVPSPPRAPPPPCALPPHHRTCVHAHAPHAHRRVPLGHRSILIGSVFFSTCPSEDLGLDEGQTKWKPVSLAGLFFVYFVNGMARAEGHFEGKFSVPVKALYWKRKTEEKGKRGREGKRREGKRGRKRREKEGGASHVTQVRVASL